MRAQISNIESVCDEVLDLTNSVAYQKHKNECQDKTLEKHLTKLEELEQVGIHLDTALIETSKRVDQLLTDLNMHTKETAQQVERT